MPRILSGATILLAILLSACDRHTPLDASPEGIRAHGELVVLTRNAPTTYFIDRDDMPTGFEYDLATDFAHYLGVPARFVTLDSITDIQDALAAGKAHMAAAGLSRLESRAERFEFGPGYYEVEQQVICRRGGPLPRDLQALADVSLVVTAGSSYEARLQHLQQTEQPGLTWRSDDTSSTEQLLQQVWEEHIDCTVADSNIVAINRRYFPELVIMFPLNAPELLSWLAPKGAHELATAMDGWYQQANEAAFVTEIAARYFAHVEVFDYVDVARFVRRIQEQLPDYEPMFRAAAEQYDLDWSLLAAQAYQESHWDPAARSPTGVRGIMMLTLRTASEVGVTNRLDPEQSILGGARYLANLRERLPDSIEEPHRTWIALAAYNVGLGHVHDARALAQRLGRNPDSWLDLRTVLPLLSQPEYYRTLRFGYARGSEPVQYVRRIRNYEEILVQQLAMHFAAQ